MITCISAIKYKLKRIAQLEITDLSKSSCTWAMGCAHYAGFTVWGMAGFAGTCTHNAVTVSFNDASLPDTARLCKMMQPKGLTLSSWRVFT